MTKFTAPHTPITGRDRVMTMMINTPCLGASLLVFHTIESQSIRIERTPGDYKIQPPPILQRGKLPTERLESLPKVKGPIKKAETWVLMSMSNAFSTTLKSSSNTHN